MGSGGLEGVQGVVDGSGSPSAASDGDGSDGECGHSPEEMWGVLGAAWGEVNR